MERSRVTVEYRHLHQQVFEHEVEGVHCVVQAINGAVPEHLTVSQALDAVQSRLVQWGGQTAGFTLPITDYADNFRLVVPSTVEWDLWPRVYSCDRCGFVLQTDRETPLARNCARCRRGVFRQLPYYRVHRCGARRQLAIPRCRVDAGHPMAFHDSGSFITAYFTCLTCAARYEINAGNCCDLGGTLDPRDRRFRLVRARDSKAFYGHHVTVVNITARLARALATPRGPLWAFAHYLGTVSNLDGLEDEALGRSAPSSTDEGNLRQLLDIVNATPGLTDEQRNSLLSTVNAKRGEEPGLDAAAQLLTDDSLDLGRADRRLIERAFLFHERKPDELSSIEGRYRASGHHGMAARMAAGRELAGELGFTRIAVLRELPLAMVAFGFTREFSDARARLQPLEPPERDRAAKRPLVTIESQTEGVYFELDPMTLWSWCQANGWTDAAQPQDATAARAWVVSQTYRADPGPAAQAIQRLTHAWAHTLIHALEGRSAFGPSSVAEYLVERLGAFLLYVANYSTFNLGGLTTVTEQHLADWLDAARDQTTCVHDPICLIERGGCHKCLALPFHCERFNRGLHRGYLLGSRDPEVVEGWLVHAARSAGG